MGDAFLAADLASQVGRGPAPRSSPSTTGSPPSTRIRQRSTTLWQPTKPSWRTAPPHRTSSSRESPPAAGSPSPPWSTPAITGCLCPPRRSSCHRTPISPWPGRRWTPGARPTRAQPGSTPSSGHRLYGGTRRRSRPHQPRIRRPVRPAAPDHPGRNSRGSPRRRCPSRATSRHRRRRGHPRHHPRGAARLQTFYAILDEGAAALDRAGQLLSTHLAVAERVTAFVNDRSST